MTPTQLTVQAARTMLGAVLREQLAAVYERGVGTAPHGVNALADPHASESYAAVMTAVNDLSQAVADTWRGSGPLDAVIPAGRYDVTAIMSGDVYVFPPGHRCRAGACLVCRKMIGGEPAAIIAAVALNDTPCLCGAVDADAFLIHADHLPLETAELQATIRRGLECPNS